MSPPDLVLGSGNWGRSVGEDQIRDQVSALKEVGIRAIDTAARYPSANPGEAERLLGDARYEELGFLINSKIMYSDGGKGNLTAEAIQKSLDQSLASLKTDKLNILYTHGPDHVTPIKEQAAAFDAQYRKGRFSKLGVCNTSPEMLQEWLEVAKDQGYVKPNVFQGQYNILSRTYETTLFPLLRKHGIAFVAFSPLAGGFLTGKVTLSTGPEDLKGTRFEVSDTNMIGRAGRNWYDKESMHTAIRTMDELCRTHKVEMSDAAVRWLVHHSLLDGEKGDGVVIGPKNNTQLEKYGAAYKAGPLPEELAQGLSDLWVGVEDDAAVIVNY